LRVSSTTSLVASKGTQQTANVDKIVPTIVPPAITTYT